MALKTQDYYMLLELRKNLFTLMESKKQAAKGNDTLKTLRSTLNDIQTTDKYIPCEPEYGVHEKNARYAFERKRYQEEKPVNDKIRNKHDRQSKGIRFWVGFLYVIVTIAAWIGGVFLVLHMWNQTRLGYDFFSSHQWEGIVKLVPSWSGSISAYSYILGAMVALIVLMLILPFLSENLYWTSHLSMFILALLMLFGCLAGFIFIGEWWNVSGGWWLLAWLPALMVSFFIPIVLIFRILYAAIVAFVFLLLIAVLPVPVVFMWVYYEVVCEKITPSPKFVSTSINDNEFKKTAEYRKAVEMDRKQDPIKKKEYLERVDIIKTSLVSQHQTLIAAEESVVYQFHYTIKACERAIEKCPINDAYKTIENVNWLLYYFEYDLAKTIQEAANLMRNDIKMKQFQDLLQKQHNEVMGGLQQINSRLSQIQKTNSEMLNQWKVIEKQSERQHREMMSKMTEMEEQQERLSQYSVQAIRDAELSMTRNLGDLKTTFVNQSVESANKVAREINSASARLSSVISSL